MHDEEVQVRNPRGANRKKFDEWNVSLPGGSRAVFTVWIGYTDGKGVLSVTSESKHFTDISVMSGDVNELKRLLDDHIHGVVQREISAGWERGAIAETRWDSKEDNHGRYRFDLSLNITPSEFRPDDVVGNRGETVVRNIVGQKTVVQRGHRTDFSDMKLIGGPLSDPEVMARMNSRLSSEHGDPVSRVVLGAEDALGFDAATRTLERFADIFAARMSYEAISVAGVPSPEDMVGMMREAAARTDRVVTASKPSF